MQTTNSDPKSQGTPIVIRDIESISQLKQVEDIQVAAWGFSDRDVVPSDQLLIVKEAGGLLIGAFVGELLVGFAYALLSIEKDRLQFHSHMLAVRPDYRNLGIGYRLKLAQRERALARGIVRMTWTFDPLQSMNAHFNLTKLGVVSDRYKVNCYGESTSSFLHRHGTDRLWVTWLLDSVRVSQRLEAGTHVPTFLTGLNEFVPLVELGGDDMPRSHEISKLLGQRLAVIEIPDDIGRLERLDFSLAMAWRQATRLAFTAALAAGYLVEEFSLVNRGHQRVGVYMLNPAQKSSNLP